MEFLKKYGDIVIVLFVALVAVVSIVSLQTVQYGIADQVEDVRSSVVHIRRVGSWQGSGCVISSDGIILTARHVLGDGGTFEVTFDDGTVYVTDEVIIDKNYDIGFLKIYPDDPLPFLPLVNFSTVRVGDGVFMIGSPEGFDNFNSITLGIVSCKERTFRDDWGWSILFQSDAPGAGPGNSGCPVFNMDGEVIGVLVGGMRTGINYSIPVAVFKDSVDVVRTWFELSRFEVLKEEVFTTAEWDHSFSE